MNIVGCVPRFIKAHAGWILTGLSVLGLTGTAVLTAKAAPKAQEALYQALDDKQGEYFKNLPSKEFERIISDPNAEYDLPELTFGEKFEAVAPHYLPAFLCYLVTAGCMIGAQIFNVKQQAALIAAYGLLAQEFSEYRQEVRLAVGDQKEQEIFAASQRRVRELEVENAKLKEANAPSLYTFAMTPEIQFESRPEHISNALMHFNRNLILRGYGPMAELYKFAGLPESVWNDPDFADYGWDQREDEITWGCGYADFHIIPVELKNGKTMNVIFPDITPYKLWSKDYLSIDEPFRGHHIDMELTKAYIREIGDSTALTPSEAQDITYFTF